MIILFFWGEKGDVDLLQHSFVHSHSTHDGHWEKEAWRVPQLVDGALRRYGQFLFSDFMAMWVHVKWSNSRQSPTLRGEQKTIATMRPPLCWWGDTLLKGGRKQQDSVGWGSAWTLRLPILAQVVPPLRGQTRGFPTPSFLLPTSLKTNSEQLASSTSLCMSSVVGHTLSNSPSWFLT